MAKDKGKSPSKSKSFLKGMGGRIGGFVKSLFKVLKENALPAAIGVFVAAAASVIFTPTATGYSVTALALSAMAPALISMAFKKFVPQDVAARAAVWAAGLLFAWPSIKAFVLNQTLTKTVAEWGIKAGGKLKGIGGWSDGSMTYGTPAPMAGAWRNQSGAGTGAWSDFARA